MAKVKIVEGAYAVELEDPDRSINSLVQLAGNLLDEKVNLGNWLPPQPETTDVV